MSRTSLRRLVSLDGFAPESKALMQVAVYRSCSCCNSANPRCFLVSFFICAQRKRAFLVCDSLILCSVGITCLFFPRAWQEEHEFVLTWGQRVTFHLIERFRAGRPQKPRDMKCIRPASSPEQYLADQRQNRPPVGWMGRQYD